MSTDASRAAADSSGFDTSHIWAHASAEITALAGKTRETVSNNKAVCAGLGIAALGTLAYLSRGVFCPAKISDEMSEFVKVYSEAFSSKELKVLSSIDWQAEARLSNMIDKFDTSTQTLVIGKLGHLKDYVLSDSEFTMRWPGDEYTIFQKAENLSSLKRWLERGGRVKDISPPNVAPGVLTAERGFIAKIAKPGQYSRVPAFADLYYSLKVAPR
jgi:hypothetical protein